MTDNSIQSSLEQFFSDYHKQHLSELGRPATVEFDSRWRSACEVGEPDEDGQIQWQPAPQHSTSFAGLEEALETALHQDIKGYYSTLWFPGLGATSPDGDLELIGMWNEDDFENLQANIIGHVIQQRRNKLPLTIFFATTLPESEYCLAIDNASGEVVLERAGNRVERVVAKNISQFIQTLTPRFDQ